MNMRMRTTKDGMVWEDNRFTIRWNVDRASWTLYDRITKQHHHDILSLGNAVEKAEEQASKKERIGLVACCKTKLRQATIAERLYSSDLFQKAASYCRRHYHRWFILSALHGLVCPSQILEPYEFTLVGASKDRRSAWAEKVFQQLSGRDLLNGLVHYYVHAGQDYAEFLVPKLQECCPVDLPMQGLGIGRQLAFYCSQVGNKDR